MKILLADPRPEVRSALRLIMERIPGCSVINEAGSLIQLLAECTQSCPDMILLEIGLVQPLHTDDQSLAGVINALNCLCPRSHVVAMSGHFEAKQEAMAAGASGFISKTDPPDEVLSGIARFFPNGS